MSPPLPSHAASIGPLSLVQPPDGSAPAPTPPSPPASAPATPLAPASAPTDIADGICIYQRQWLFQRAPPDYTQLHLWGVNIPPAGRGRAVVQAGPPDVNITNPPIEGVSPLTQPTHSRVRGRGRIRI